MGEPDNFLSGEDDYVMSAGESPMEAHTLRTFLRFGCWNVKTVKKLYQLLKTAQMCRERDNYGISVLGVSECRWTGIGKVITQTGHVIIYSGKEENMSMEWP